VVQSNSYSLNDAWHFTDGLALARGPFDLGAGQSVTVHLMVDVIAGTPGQNLTNTAEAVDARFGARAAGSAILPIQAGAASPTMTPSPTPSPSPGATPNPTATPAAAFVVSLVRDQGQAWLGGNDLRFSVNITQTAGVAINDLVLRFFSDIAEQNQFLDVVEPNTLLGPSDAMSPAAWRLVTGGIDGGVDMGTLALAPGASLASPRRIFTKVMGGEGTTLTSQVVVSSAALGLAVTTSAQTYIAFGPPDTPTPASIGPGSPTPIAEQGRITAYPQPAAGQLCFSYYAPGPGPLILQIYNVAFQLVGELKEEAQGGQVESTCSDVSGLAPGVYYYRAQVGGYRFPAGQFGIAR
jgi:hypothetical protein